jgi:hypothetical protein
MATATCHTTAGVFATRDAADRAVAELKRAGYRDDQIGVVAKNADGKTVKRDGSRATDTNAAEGAAIGAAAGAGAMALGSLAVTFGVIPVIGPVLAMGPLAAALVSAGAGAAAGGVAGALIGWGIPEDDAKFYEGEVRAGRYLVTVECGQGDDARSLLTRHGGTTACPPRKCDPVGRQPGARANARRPGTVAFTQALLSGLLNSGEWQRERALNLAAVEAVPELHVVPAPDPQVAGDVAVLVLATQVDAAHVRTARQDVGEAGSPAPLARRDHLDVGHYPPPLLPNTSAARLKNQRSVSSKSALSVHAAVSPNRVLPYREK